jgi:hypothetical protein
LPASSKSGKFQKQQGKRRLSSRNARTEMFPCCEGLPEPDEGGFFQVRALFLRESRIASLAKSAISAKSAKGV